MELTRLQRETLEHQIKHYRALSGLSYPNNVSALGLGEHHNLWAAICENLEYEVWIDSKYIDSSHINKDTGVYKDLCEWLDKNTSGLWIHSYNRFMFEKEEDAALFKLKFL